MGKNNLKKSIKTKDVLALAFGTMIGWGWIMLSGKWAAEAGMAGAMIAYGVGAVLCIFVGLAYAELTPAMPYTGGSVVFAYKSLGYWPSVMVGLSTSFAYIGVACWEGPAFASAVDYIVEIPKAGYLWTVQGYEVYFTWALIAILAAVIITVINVLGAKEAAVFQTVATLGLIIVGLVFLFGGIAFGSVQNTKPFFTDMKGFSSVLLMVPAMFVGFDVIPQAASEMDVPLSRIPRLLILSIAAAAAWYILMIMATCLSAPVDVREGGSIPVADAMAFAFGGAIWGKLCILGALCGILTSWNGFLYGAARCLYAMSKARMLPAFLADIHPRYGTPYKAIILCGVLSVCACFLGKSALSWFVNASSFGVVVMYFVVSLSFIFLRKRFPDMPRPYAIKRFTLVAVGSMFVSLFFLYLYLPMGPSSLIGIEWLFVLGWFITFGILALMCRIKNKDLGKEERWKLLITEE